MSETIAQTKAAETYHRAAKLSSVDEPGVADDTMGDYREEQIEVPPEIKAANLLHTVDGNPGIRVPVYQILKACDVGRREEVTLLDDIEHSLSETGHMPVQPLSSLVGLLVRNEALVESLEVDGQPYEGTVEDAFNDDSIADDAEVLIYESITECGSMVLAALNPAKRAIDLFADRIEHKEALLRTLALCNVEAGLSTKQLEVALDADGYLHRDERTNIPHVYPSMYANFLKDVDCIEWRHAWVTTDLGREILSAL